MNPKQKQITIGVLVTIAVVLMFQRFGWPYMKAHGWVGPAAKPPVAGKAEPAVVPVTGVAGKVTAGTVELTVVKNGATRWYEAPRRDPFHRKVQVVIRLNGTNPPAMTLLHLKAIWRQDGSTLAVVNDQVLGEGDPIMAFTIQTIEDNRVWVTGPNGREAIEFKALPASLFDRQGPAPAPVLIPPGAGPGPAESPSLGAPTPALKRVMLVADPVPPSRPNP